MVTTQFDGDVRYSKGVSPNQSIADDSPAWCVNERNLQEADRPYPIPFQLWSTGNRYHTYSYEWTAWSIIWSLPVRCRVLISPRRWILLRLSYQTQHSSTFLSPALLHHACIKRTNRPYQQHMPSVELQGVAHSRTE